MFRVIISSILRSTRLCLQLVVLYNAPADGPNYLRKHVELIVIINKTCYCCIWLAVYIIIN